MKFISMKIIKKKALFVILFEVAFLNTTCSKQKLFATITYEGNVYDSTGHPLPGVNVELQGCIVTDGGSEHHQTFVMGDNKTDASGHFYIHAKAARSNLYLVYIDGWSKNSPYGYISGDALKSSYYTTVIIP